MTGSNTRPLGRSGIEVSALGMGCWAIGGPWTMQGHAAGWGAVDDDESIRAIHAALDHGITFFDTAANYGTGHSERVLGRALNGRRDGAVIATKFGHVIDEEARTMRPDDDTLIERLREDCEASLRRLDVDVIDLYQLHAGDFDPARAPEVVDVLEELVAAGKIRAYGWSTDDPARAAIFAEGEHCTAVQHALNVFHRADNMLAVCDEHDLASVNKRPLMSGFLTGKYTADAEFPADDYRSRANLKEGRAPQVFDRVQDLRDVLTSGGRTMAQGALAWIWAYHPRAIPIPGIRTVAQAEQNAGALGFGPLTDEQMAQVEEIVGDLTVQVDDRYAPAE